MKVDRQKVVAYLGLGVLFFATSLSLIVPYTGGDQRWYRSFYDALPGASLLEVPVLQAIFTGSAEPVYGYLMWIGANLGINKDVYISIFNVGLLLSIFLFLYRNNAHWAFTALTLTNFYTIVLLTSAERLKISYLVIVLSVIASSRFARRAFMVVAPLAHFQAILLYLMVLAGFAAKTKVRVVVKKRAFKIAVLAAPLAIFMVLVFLAVFGPSLLSKATYYLRSLSPANAANIIFLIFVSMLVLDDKFRILLILLSSAVVAVLLGGDRVNMIAVVIFFYFCVVQKKTLHPLALIVMLYFSLKSLGYVAKVYQSGSGF